jgi:hypothetical protein
MKGAIMESDSEEEWEPEEEEESEWEPEDEVVVKKKSSKKTTLAGIDYQQMMEFMANEFQRMQMARHVEDAKMDVVSERSIRSTPSKKSSAYSKKSSVSKKSSASPEEASVSSQSLTPFPGVGVGNVKSKAKKINMKITARGA